MKLKFLLHLTPLKKKMSLESTILSNNDLLGELLKYLTFHDKLTLGKTCNKTYIKFYNRSISIQEQYNYLFLNISRTWINHITYIILDKLYELNKINFSDYYYYCTEQLHDNYKQEFRTNRSHIDIYVTNIKNTLFSIYARQMIELSNQYDIQFDNILIHLSNIFFAYGSIPSLIANTTDSKHSNKMSKLLLLSPNYSHFLFNKGRSVSRII